MKSKKAWIICGGFLLVGFVFVLSNLYFQRKITNDFHEKFEKINEGIENIEKTIENNNCDPIFFTEEPTFGNIHPGPEAMMEYMKAKNFQNLYSRLVSGLDEESIETVNRILTRFQQMADGGPRTGFTIGEMKKLDKLRREFKILKLGENCFAWKDYLLPINHFEASVFYYQNGITNIENEKLKNKDIVDVGGYIGDSAIIFSKYTNKKVYSFEPSSKNIELMNKTISMNKKDNIVPVNLGLESKSQEIKIPLEVSVLIRTDAAADTKDLSEETSETAKITTLDQYVSENKLDVGLIKVDIEGAEQDFLKGAENTIKQQKPFLLLSIYHNPSDFFNIKPLIESWDLGYNFRIVKCVDGNLCTETLLVGSPKS